MYTLDDPTYINRFDSQDALGFAAQQPTQLAHDFGLKDATLPQDIHNVVFAGMGGSALAAEIASSYPQLTIPFVICKGYDLPNFVNEKTLVIAASYSGNTEETLSALEQAEQKGAAIAVIAHGGKLAEKAKASGSIFAEIPECPQPRTATFYMYRATVELLVAAGQVQASVLDELADLVAPLEAAVKAWASTVPTDDNPAKKLAEEMAGKTPIIYAGPKMYPAAYKWKISANENAKNTAWSNYIPEFNHNEFLGWSSHPVEKPFAVIDLISSFEHPRILKRFEVTDRMLSGMRPKAHTIEARGDSIIEHILYLVLFGDFATTYMALLNGVNPTPVDLVEKFKIEMN